MAAKTRGTAAPSGKKAKGKTSKKQSSPPPPPPSTYQPTAAHTHEEESDDDAPEVVTVSKMHTSSPAGSSTSM